MTSHEAIAPICGCFKVNKSCTYLVIINYVGIMIIPLKHCSTYRFAALLNLRSSSKTQGCIRRGNHSMEFRSLVLVHIHMLCCHHSIAISCATPYCHVYVVLIPWAVVSLRERSLGLFDLACVMSVSKLL